MTSSSSAEHDPPEHAGWVHYRPALAQVSDTDEAALVAAVLEDLDQAMAQSAVAGHVDLRAAALHHVPAHPAWADLECRGADRGVGLVAAQGRHERRHSRGPGRSRRERTDPAGPRHRQVEERRETPVNGKGSRPRPGAFVVERELR
jgi:hypothetical protein